MTGVRTRSDTLIVGVLLAGVGGYLDGYTYQSRGVFANAQTGNIVLFGVEAAARHWRDAMLHLPAVAAFLLGVVAAETLSTPTGRRTVHRPLRVVLAVEITALAGVAAMPSSTSSVIVTCIVSFVAAIQFSTFRLLVDTPYSTLMTTGNLRSMAIALHRWAVSRDSQAARQAGRLGTVVTAFLAGAVVGAVVTTEVGAPAVEAPAGVLVVVLVILIRETRRLERAGSGVVG